MACIPHSQDNQQHSAKMDITRVFSLPLVCSRSSTDLAINFPRSTRDQGQQVVVIGERYECLALLPSLAFLRWLLRVLLS